MAMTENQGNRTPRRWGLRSILKWPIRSDKGSRRDEAELTSVNDTGAGLVVLLLGAPQVLEGAERSCMEQISTKAQIEYTMLRTKNRSTDPDGVFPLWGSDNLDLHARWAERGQLLLHTIRNAGVHGGATGEDDVAVEITTDIEVTLEDRVVSGLVDTSCLQTQEGWLEEGFGSTESGNVM